MEKNGILGLLVRVLTWVYLAFSLLGVLVYVFLPQGLNTFGAMTGSYLFLWGVLDAGIGLSQTTAYVVMACGGLLLILTLGLCAYALVKKMHHLLLAVVVMDVLLSSLFFLCRGATPDGSHIMNLCYAGLLALSIYGNKLIPIK